MNEKVRYLLKNFGFLTLGTSATRILTFLLVPIYTYLLTPNEYGIFDIYISTITLFLPIFTLNISEAVLRFTINNKENIKGVFTSGVFLVTISWNICILFLLINNYFLILNTIKEFYIIFFIIFFFSSLLELFSSFARGINKVNYIAISGVLGTFITIISNILLLVILKLHLLGFFLSYIIGLLSQVIYLGISIRVYNYLANVKEVTEEIYKMIKYSVPLVWNSLAWWLNDLSCRYVISFIMGVYETGIYSASARIPGILAVFQAIFNKVWIISAIKDIDEDEAEGFFSRVYKYYNFCMIMMCSILIIANKVIAKFLLSGDFFHGWKYSPFLLVSLVFGAISGFLGGIFAAKKDTKLCSFSTILGAIVNIVVCYYLVSNIGTLGAAIAALISSFIIWYIRLLCVEKYIRLRINLHRDLLSYFCLLCQAILSLNLVFDFELYISQVVAIVIIVIINKENFVELLNFSKFYFRDKKLNGIQK